MQQPSGTSASWRLAVACPIPAEDEIPADEIDPSSSKPSRTPAASPKT